MYLQRTAMALAVFGAVAIGGSARANTGADPHRLLTGSVVYPKGSWALDGEFEYQMPRYHDASRDVLESSLVVEHGLTETVSVEFGGKGKGRRPGFAFEALELGGRRAFKFGTVQTALFADYSPSVRKGPDAVGFGLEAMRNFGPWTAQGIYAAESEKPSGGPRRLTSALHAAGYYRFGLQGMLGPSWYYSSERGHEIHLHLAAALNERFFIGIEPKAGLSRRGREFSADFLFGLYYGPFGLGEWLME